MDTRQVKALLGETHELITAAFATHLCEEAIRTMREEYTTEEVARYVLEMKGLRDDHANSMRSTALAPAQQHAE